MRRSGPLDKRHGLLMNKKMRVDDVEILRRVMICSKLRIDVFTKNMKKPVSEVVWSTLLNYCSEVMRFG